uniref:Cadherin domain-containing protein n=1 Tax=Electrophorus electricus TaxID=8005 RepID=A0AAY5EMS4_ELEEL
SGYALLLFIYLAVSTQAIHNFQAILSDPTQLQRIEVNILDVNDNAPSFQEISYTINITESAYTGERFPLPVAIDADSSSNSVKSYKLSLNEHFSLDVQTGGEQIVSSELVLQKALDREKHRSHYNITVTATDEGSPSLSNTTLIAVDVSDVNDNAPHFPECAVNVYVNENSEIGAVIYTVSAFDPDVGDNAMISYSLQESAKTGLVTTSFVSINSDNGDIHSLQSFNYEEMKSFQFKILATDSGVPPLSNKLDHETNKAIEIRVQARDKGQTPRAAYSKVLIEVTDVNDNIPEISVTSLINIVKEGSARGTVVALITVKDNDADQNGAVTLKISNSFPFRIQNAYKNKYSLEVNGVLDREVSSQYDISITATDEGTPPLSSTTVISVLVSDVNDNAPHFPETLLNVYVKENSQVGVVIYTVSAFDPDVDENARISYSFLESSRPVKSMVNINSDNGDIHTLQSFNYEEIKTFQFKPRAALCKVLVEIVDINDNAPDISVNSLVNMVKEDAAAGTMVGLITVKDGDAGKNGAVILQIHDSVPFKIQNTYKNKYSLVVDGPLDRESMSQYNITITAADGGSPPLSSQTVITVHVSDVNDNAPSFPDSVINVSVKENSQIGTVIHIVTAFDPDVGDNSRITYSLMEGPLTSMVNMNPDNGEIYMLQSFNCEEIKTFQLKVQATDSGVPPLSGHVALNVFVLDENDNKPMILAPYSEHGSVNTENLPFSADAGYFVAKIRAVDADSGYNALLSYHMSEPKGNNLFRIGTSSGEIRTKRRMSDNDLKTHPLVIMVSDNGEPSLSATVSIDVVVAESGSDVQTKLRHVPMKEESFSDLNLYLLIAIVSVSVIFLLSLISLIAVKCYRTDGSFSRAVCGNCFL